MSIKRSFFGLTTNFMIYFTTAYSLPVFTNVMTKRGFTPGITGGTLGLASLFFVIAMVLVLKLLKKTMTKRVSLYIGLFA